MKNKKISIIFIIILSFIILISLIILIVSLSNNKVSFKLFGKSQYINLNQYEINDINKISVNTTTFDVRLVIGANDVIAVNLYGDKKGNVEIKNEDGILKIESNNESKCIGLCNDNEYIEVSVPSNYFHKINVNTVSGDLQVSNLPSLKLDFNTTSGDIDVHGISEINVVAVSGDIDIKKVTDKINLETTSGDIEINELSINQESIIKTVSGDVEIEKSNDIQVKPSTRSGSVEIGNNNPNTNNILSIITRSGDIEVN